MTAPLNPSLTRPVRVPTPGIFAAIFKRALFLLPFALSAGLLWWSLSRLNPVLKRSSELTERTSKIVLQIEEMEQRRQTLLQNRLPERFDEFLNRNVKGQEGLAAWLDGLRLRAVGLGLELQPQFGESQSRQVGDENLTLLPVTLDLRPDPAVEGSDSAYRRILEFTHYLGTHVIRADIVELTVTGQDGQAAHAVINLNLWGLPPKS